MKTIAIEFGIVPKAFCTFKEATSATREGAKEIEAQINKRTMIDFRCAYGRAAIAFDNGKTLGVSAGDGRVECEIIPSMGDLDETPPKVVEFLTPKGVRLEWALPSILSTFVGQTLRFDIGIQYVTFFSPNCTTEHMFDVLVARDDDVCKFLFLSEA